MFENDDPMAETGNLPAAAVLAQLDPDQVLTALMGWLAALGTEVSDAARVDRIRALEQLKAAAAAAQARTVVAFADSQLAEQRAAGTRARDLGRGIGEQVALAAGVSPHRGRRTVAWARILVRELPATYAALERGDATEWQTWLVARETATLPTAEHRAELDRVIAGKIATLGDRDVLVETRRLVCRLDPHGQVKRRRRAEAERQVTVRPAPDTMAYLTALLPAAQAIAVHAALTQHAGTVRAAGDSRSRGQVMADTLVERCTGQTSATGIDVEIGLVITDRALLGRPDRRSDDDAVPCAEHDAGHDEPAVLVGYGPIPAEHARALVRDARRVSTRDLHADPDGRLVRAGRRRRRFTTADRHATIYRDQHCRTPYCSAPIRETDHALRYADGGATILENADGLCQACNLAREAIGWTITPDPAGTNREIIITTPTGKQYRSAPPDLPGTDRRRRQRCAA